MDLLNFLRVLSQRKWLILAVTSVAVITTYLIARQAPEVYRATARLATGLSERNTPFSLGGGETAPLQEYEVQASFRNLEEAIRSPQVLSLVSYQLILHDLEKPDPFRSTSEVRQEFSGSEMENARQNFRQKLDSIQTLQPNNLLENRHMEMLKMMQYDFETLRGTLNARRIPGTDYIAISFSAENPYLSAFVANTMCQEFIRYYKSRRADQSQRKLEFLTEDVARKRADLSRKVRLWEETHEGTNFATVSQTMDKMLSRIDRLEYMEGASKAALNRYERQLADFQRENRSSYVRSILAMNHAAESQIELQRRQLARLNRNYVEGDFRQERVLDSIQQTIISLKDEIYQQVTEAQPELGDESWLPEAIELELRIEVNNDRVKAINQTLRRLSREPQHFTAIEQDASPLTRSIEAARDMYLASLTDLNETLLTADEVDLTSMTQVDYVQPPEQPEPSNTWLLVLLSGLASLSLGVLVTFVLEYLDTSIKLPSRFSGLTGISLLGTLNRLQSTNLDLVQLFDEPQTDKNLETYKQLLRKIRHGISDAGPRTLLVTGTKANTGKTSLMISLAYAMSLEQRKILLIDTNFKNNSLTQIIGARPTLEAYMKDRLPKNQLISSSIFEGVDVIGCESGDYSPAELFKGDRFEDLLIELADTYDLVMMEGPHLNQFADSKELVRYATRVLPVFSASDPINDQDQASINYLQSLGDQVIGAVLNKVELVNLSH